MENKPTIETTIEYPTVMNKIIAQYLLKEYPEKVTYDSKSDLYSMEFPFVDLIQQESIPGRKLRFHLDMNWIMFVADHISSRDLPEEFEVVTMFNRCRINTPSCLIDIVDVSTNMAVFKAVYQFICIKYGLQHIQFTNDVGDYLNLKTGCYVDQKLVRNV